MKKMHIIFLYLLKFTIQTTKNLKWNLIFMANKYKNNPITIRKTEEMEEMLDFLQKKLLLTPTSIMRVGLARLYEYEFNKGDDDL